MYTKKYKKIRFIYAVAFALLVEAIICNLPLALEYLSLYLPLLAGTIWAFEILMRQFWILAVPAFLAAFYPFLHFVPSCLLLILIAKPRKKYAKKQILFLVLLNALYLLTAYGSYIMVCAAFSR